MGGETLQVIDYADAGGSAGVETGETPVFEGDFVIEANELHEHVADEEDEVFDVASFVFGGHNSRDGFGRPRAFGRGALAGGGGAGGGVVKGHRGEMCGGWDAWCGALGTHLSGKFGFGGERRNRQRGRYGPFLPFAAGFRVL